MQSETEQFLLSVLDRIEQGEARLLTWGLVDGVVDQREMDALIEPLLDQAMEAGFEQYLEPREVIEVLLARRWIAPVELEDGAIGYRSRMAETVRLLQRLRQLFPKHAGRRAGSRRRPWWLTSASCGAAANTRAAT